MTCIIGIIDKENRKIYVAGDSAGVNPNSYSLNIRKDKKVFIRDDYIIGFTTSFRMGQLLMFGGKLPKYKKNKDGDPFKFMVKKFIPSIRKILNVGGYATKKDNLEIGGNFIVGLKGRLFEIHSNFQVAEVYENYLACGCGRDYVLGALETFFSLVDKKDMDYQKMINFTLKIAEKKSAGVVSPYNIEILEY